VNTPRPPVLEAKNLVKRYGPVKSWPSSATMAPASRASSMRCPVR